MNNQEFLELCKKRSAQLQTEMQEIARTVQERGDGPALTDQERDKMVAYKNEQRGFQATIAQLEADIEAEARSTKNPTDPPKTRSQREAEERAQDAERDANRERNSDERLFKNFRDQIKAVIRKGQTGETDQRLIQVNQRAVATGMSENVDVEGGFFLEAEVVNEMLPKADFGAVLLPEVSKRVISGRSLKIYGVDESSRVAGQLSGGIAIYPADEADAYTASKPKFKKVEFDLKKIIALCYMTDEEMDDIPALESKVITEFQDAFGTELDGYLYAGDGATVSEGMLNTPSMVTTTIEGSQTLSNGPVLLANLTKMRSRLLPGLRKDALWLVNQELEPYLLTLMAGSFPALLPAGGYGGVPEERLLGIRYKVFEHCKAPGTIGDITLCVPKRYVMVQKGGGLKQAASIHVRFLNDENVLKFTYRFDGKVPDAAALTPRNGTLTLSSVVTLGTRS
ncbi:MAG: phage major capsid protein [Candidatus Obscuribacterales bacterium]|nr:phage major capsid protein [Candidatus Obscuribacterales bacterium]